MKKITVELLVEGEHVKSNTFDSIAQAMFQVWKYQDHMLAQGKKLRKIQRYTLNERKYVGFSKQGKPVTVVVRNLSPNNRRER
jgi:hypothetical protein